MAVYWLSARTCRLLRPSLPEDRLIEFGRPGPQVRFWQVKPFAAGRNKRIRELLRRDLCTPYTIRRGSMATGYVEQREGGYYVAGSRVSLDSVVYAFLRGESPEGIVESFPSLGLEQVFGAVAFYLANRESTDAYLQDARADFARMRDEARRKHPALYSKLEAARHGAPSPRA
jgi:uncharacterized protein (DUF433 family)